MLTLIGDVHGEKEKYMNIMRKHENTVQLGDCDFYYHYMKDFDPKNHKIIPGNHDNHDTIYSLPHCLGRFGHHVDHENVSFFFVAGADSIDRKYRMIGVDWWENEELSYKEQIECIDLYSQIKPDYVLTHDCPQIVAQMFYGIFDVSRTRYLLQNMFEVHQPQIWVFGHHHKSRDEVILGTRFKCLRELETMEL